MKLKVEKGTKDVNKKLFTLQLSWIIPAIRTGMIRNIMVDHRVL